MTPWATKLHPLKRASRIDPASPVARRLIYRRLSAQLDMIYWKWVAAKPTPDYGGLANGYYHVCDQRILLRGRLSERQTAAPA